MRAPGLAMWRESYVSKFSPGPMRVSEKYDYELTYIRIYV